MSLWGICALFDPSALRLENAFRFAKRVRAQGLKLCIVTLGREEQLLPDCDLWIELSGGARLWQKERMLNVALEALPPDCDLVAWLDADVLFENDGWMEDTERALRNFLVVQLFDQVFDDSEYVTSMAACHKFEHAKPVCIGHPGFAWAAHRELLAKHGFYDRSIIGGGDTVMAWASYGLLWPGYERAPAYFSPAHLADIAEWSRGWHADVNGNVGLVLGTIRHLFHGPKDTRKYMERTRILKDYDFDPNQDIIKGGDVWRWSSEKAPLHRAVLAYLDGRESLQSANAGKPVAAVERSEEHQQKETVRQR